MESIFKQLQHNKDVFYTMFFDVPEDMILWKSSPDRWCLLEILCHLYDEERDDFRFRVQWLLEKPNITPPPFDQTLWVTERNYIGQDYHVVLEKFIAERNKSVRWLRQLEQPQWDNSFEHPKLGPLTSKYYLINWLAHDYLHQKQILKLKFDYLRTVSGEQLDYAGNWV